MRYYTFFLPLLVLALIMGIYHLTRSYYTNIGKKVLYTEVNQEKPGLAEYMFRLQIYTHKLSLSVENENADLADFYMHELEETTEDIIENIKEYEGHKISELTKTMLEPAMEPVEKSLDKRDWPAARKHRDALIQSCNACHTATQHEFIKITPGTENNPYNQDFSPQ